MAIIHATDSVSQLAQAVDLLNRLSPFRDGYLATTPWWRGIVGSDAEELVAAHLRLFGEIGLDAAMANPVTIAAVLFEAASAARSQGRSTLWVNVVADPFCQQSAGFDPRRPASDFRDDLDWLAARLATFRSACEEVSRSVGVSVVLGYLLCEQEQWSRGGTVVYYGRTGQPKTREVLTSDAQIAEWDNAVRQRLVDARTVCEPFFGSARIQWADMAAGSLMWDGAFWLNGRFPRPLPTGTWTETITCYEGSSWSRAIDRLNKNLNAIPIYGPGVSSSWQFDAPQPVRAADYDRNASWLMGVYCARMRNARSRNQACWLWPGLGRSDAWGSAWLAHYVAFVAGLAGVHDQAYLEVPNVFIGPGLSA